MTEDAWRRIADRIESTWPGPAGAADRYRDQLDDLDPESVEQALDGLLIEYRNEAPSPRVVRERAREIPPDADGPSESPGYDAATDAPASTVEGDPLLAPSAGEPRRESQKATVALILGVAGLITIPIVLSVAAVIVGNRALDEIARSPGLGGARKARTGRVLGWIGLAIMVITVIVALVAGTTD